MTAGTPTSTVPMTSPNPSEASATVRMPGPGERAEQADDAVVQRVRVRPGAAGPLSAKPAGPERHGRAAATRPMPGHGAATRNAAIAGPRMKKTSRLIAS